LSSILTYLWAPVSLKWGGVFVQQVPSCATVNTAVELRVAAGQAQKAPMKKKRKEKQRQPASRISE